MPEIAQALSAEEIQQLFPHGCKELLGVCAICRWVREHWSGRSEAVGKKDRA